MHICTQTHAQRTSLPHRCAFEGGLCTKREVGTKKGGEIVSVAFNLLNFVQLLAVTSCASKKKV